MRIPPMARLDAARKLVGRAAGPSASAQTEAARRFLRAAETHAIDLSHLWATVTCDARGAPPEVPTFASIRHVVLAAPAKPGAGGTAMFFTSAPSPGPGRAELAAAIDAACHGLRGVRLAQALLEPDERGALESFLLAGFGRVGELLYMRRTWTPPLQEVDDAWPEGVSVRTWSPGDDDALVEALDRSYVETLDCPELCGLRSTRDVLDSHRSTGSFDPDLWWIVRVAGRPAGALLINPCPEQGHSELVYLGLAPDARGRGIASRLLALGLRALSDRAERDVTLAVDTRNAPAVRLYERFGFAAFARRIALVRPLGA